jgi:hypothetical protein
MLQFAEPQVIEGLRKLKPQTGNMVTVRYLEAGRTVGGRVIGADLRSEPATVEIEYTRLISIAAMGVGNPLPTAEATFVLQGSEDHVQTLDLVNRRLFHFFELVEGVRALVNEAGAQQGAAVYAEPPVLRSLSVASPAFLVIEVAPALNVLLPLGFVAAVLKAAGAFPAKRKEWYEGTGHKLDNKAKEVELQLTQLELAAKQEETALRIEMLQRLRQELPNSTLTDEAIARVVEENVLPPLRALGELGIESLSVDEPTGPSGEDSD